MGDRNQMAAMAQQAMAQQQQPQQPFQAAQMPGGSGLSPEYVQQLIALANPGGILRAGQQPQGDPSGQQFLLGATNAQMPERSAFMSRQQTGMSNAGHGIAYSPVYSNVFDETGYQKAIEQWEKSKYGKV